jgi:hypothetical protein
VPLGFCERHKCRSGKHQRLVAGQAMERSQSLDAWQQERGEELTLQ